MWVCDASLHLSLYIHVYIYIYIYIYIFISGYLTLGPAMYNTLLCRVSSACGPMRVPRVESAMDASQVLTLVLLEDLFQQVIRYLSSSQIMSACNRCWRCKHSGKQVVEYMTMTLALSGWESNSDSTHVQLPERLAIVNNCYSVSKGLADTLKCLTSKLVENIHSTVLL